MKRIQELGSDGLKKQGDELNEAIALNALPLPTSILAGLPHPNSTNSLHKVNIYRTGDAIMPNGLDLESWPTYAEFYDCPTKFIHVSVVLYPDQVVYLKKKKNVLTSRLLGHSSHTKFQQNFVPT